MKSNLSNNLKTFDPKWVELSGSNYTFLVDSNPIDCASKPVQSLVKMNYGEDIHCADERCEMESHIHFTCYNPASLHGFAYYDLTLVSIYRWDRAFSCKDAKFETETTIQSTS